MIMTIIPLDFCLILHSRYSIAACRSSAAVVVVSSKHEKPRRPSFSSWVGGYYLLHIAPAISIRRNEQQ